MVRLATSKYHGGLDGMPELTIALIHDCGYNSLSTEDAKDVLLCYHNIQLIHCKVITGWENYRSGQSGPSVEYILEKALLNIP
jgi:hypothetical protein